MTQVLLLKAILLLKAMGNVALLFYDRNRGKSDAQQLFEDKDS
jgi:hypothetical protein